MNPNIKKYNTFLSLLQTPNELETKISKLFEDEFNELYEDILIKTDKEFLETLLFNTKFSIEDNFSSEAMTNVTLILILEKVKQFYFQEFQKEKLKLTKVLKLKGEMFIENGQQFSFLKHCINQNDIPLHKCNEKNNFITVLTESSFHIYDIVNNYRRNSHSEYKNIYAIICTKCKKAYKSNYITLFCNCCKIPYYTRILAFNENANNNFQPATWEKYHCNIIINQQMMCPKCNHSLYIDIKNDKLICKNCNFCDDAENVEWKCIKCNQSFYSNAKIYNPYIFKPYANAIKKGLLEKISAIPKKIKCGHNSENIVHKSNCDGKLYITELNGVEMIVCSKCKAMTKFDNFIFECPICNMKFKGNEENLEEEFKAFSRCKTIMKNNMKYNKNIIKSGEMPKLTQRKKLSSINLTNSEKKKINFSSSNNIVYSPQPVKNNDLSNANTSNTDSVINKDSYNENEKENLFVFTQKNNNNNNNNNINNNNNNNNNINNNNNNNNQNAVNKFHKSYTSNDNSDNKSKRRFSRSLIIKNKKVNYEDDYYDSSDDDFDEPNYAIQKKKTSYEKNFEKNIEKKILNSSFDNKINNLSLPNFDPYDYTIISQIGEGKKSKIFCVKSDDNKFFAMKKKVLMHHNDLKNLLNSYKIQFSLMNEANITQIYSINYNDDEFSVLEELGINSWNSEIATMKKMKKFYTEEELINIIYQLSSSLELLQKKDMCHFNINPKNIIVYKDKSYKLSDLEYIRTIKDSNIISNDNEFISPQLFNLYNEKKNNKAYINLIKSDVYSLGLCIIYTMTRTNDINNIYRDFILNKSNLDSDNLVCNYFKYPLNTMDNDNFYSHKFQNLINHMLKIKEDERFDFSEIINYLCKEYQFYE